MGELNFEERLRGAVRRHLGGDADVVSIERLAGGANAGIHALDVRRGESVHRLVLRRAEVDEAAAITLPKALEAAVQSAAHRAGVRAPYVHFVLEPSDELGSGFVMDRSEGDASPAKLLADGARRDELLVELAVDLARIHATPLGGLDALPRATPREQVEALAAHYRSYDRPSPAFELAIRRLLERAPVCAAPTLVHGDFRMGNVLARDGRLLAVLDWELSHVGDPIEDLGWACVTSWRFARARDRFAGLGSVESLRAAYVAAGGRSFDDDQLSYWELYGTFRWGVICLVQAFGRMADGTRPVERLAIGRRVSEVEFDLVRLLAC